MTAEYEMTKEDLAAFILYYLVHSPTARRQYLISWLLPPFVWLLLCSGFWFLAVNEEGAPLDTFLALLPLFSGVPLYLIAFPWASRRKIRKVIAGMASEGKNRGLFGRLRVTISPDGITESGEFVQNSTAWQAVERVSRNGDYAFVYINAMAGIVIPRRAFAASEEFDEFVRAATDYHAKAIG